MMQSNAVTDRLGFPKPADPPPLLLTVAVGPDAAAIRAWDTWRGQGGDIGTLDRDEHPVLPMLYRRLVALGIDDVDLQRLLGIHRQCWARNQQVLSGFRGDLELLAQGTIPVMVGPRIALIAADDRDVGATYLGVPSCLVPAPAAATALSHLVDHGFALSVPGTPRSIAATRRSAPLIHLDDPGHVVELQWSQYRNEERGPWSRSRPCAVGSVDSLAPSLEDLMVDVLTSSRCGQPGWMLSVLDAMFIVSRFGIGLDWSLVIDEARRRRASITLTQGLRHLHEDFGAPVPLPVLRDLEATKEAWLDRAIDVAKGRQAPGADQPVTVFEDWLRVGSTSGGRWIDPHPWRFAMERMGAQSNREAARRMVGSVAPSTRRQGPEPHGAPVRSLHPQAAARRIRGLRGLCGALVGCEVPETDWGDVAFLAREFGLEPALHSRLQDSDPGRILPDAVSAQLREAYRHNAASLVWRTRQLKDVVRVLNRIDVEPMLIKGSRSLVETPRQQLLERYMHDLDLVVPTPHFDDSIEALRQHGYLAVPGGGKSATYEWSVSKAPEPGPIDFHFEMGPGRVTAILPTDVAWSASQRRTVEGHRYRVLSPVHEIVHAVIHTELGDRAWVDKQIDPRRLLSIADLLNVDEGTDAWHGACRYLGVQGGADYAGAVAGLLGELFGLALDEPPTTSRIRREVQERLIVFALPNVLARRREIRGAFATPYLQARYPDLSPRRARLRHAVTLIGQALRGEWD
jgi:Uncharacterised nucleotidyltransferase